VGAGCAAAIGSAPPQAGQVPNSMPKPWAPRPGSRRWSCRCCWSRMSMSWGGSFASCGLRGLPAMGPRHEPRGVVQSRDRDATRSVTNLNWGRACRILVSRRACRSGCGLGNRCARTAAGLWRKCSGKRYRFPEHFPIFQSLAPQICGTLSRLRHEGTHPVRSASFFHHSLLTDISRSSIARLSNQKEGADVAEGQFPITACSSYRCA